MPSHASMRKHMTYANIVATLALFIAVSTGGAWAASQLITGRQIKDGSIASRDLGSGQVKAADLGTGAVKAPKLATGAVTSTAIADGTIATMDLASDSVGGSKVADGSLSGADLAAGTVGSTQLADGSISNAKFGDISIGSGQINAAYTAQMQNTVTRVYDQASPAIIQNGFTGTSDASCPAGSKVVGGGGMWGTPSGDEQLIDSYPVDNYTWRVMGKNPAGGDVWLGAWAVCLNST